MDVLIVILMSLGVLLLIPLSVILIHFLLYTETGFNIFCFILFLFISFCFFVILFMIFSYMHNFAVGHGWIEPFLNFIFLR